MFLSGEPAASIREVIGGARARELGDIAVGVANKERFTPDELHYLSECFEYIAQPANSKRVDEVLGGYKHGG